MNESSEVSHDHDSFGKIGPRLIAGQVGRRIHRCNYLSRYFASMVTMSPAFIALPFSYSIFSPWLTVRYRPNPAV
jgi:hypothetical protein